MHPNTTTTAVTLAEKLATVPAPAAMFGHNLGNAIAENTDRLKAAGKYDIASDTERLSLDSFVKEAKKVRKVAADKRLDITRILDEIKAAYTSEEKAQTGDLDKAIAAAEAKINTFLRAERAKEQARIAEIEAQAAKDLARKRSSEGKAQVQQQTEQQLAEATTVSAASGVQLKWLFEVQEPLDVPRAYLEVDESAIRRAVASGTRNIPGVRIYQDIARSGR